jgi:chromosome segregation ATPase
MREFTEYEKHLHAINKESNYLQKHCPSLLKHYLSVSQIIGEYRKELTEAKAEVQEYHELTLAQTAKIRELKAEVERLQAELALLRKVATAAAGVVKQREFTEALPEDWLLLVAHNEYEAWKEGTVER